jgi:hypothetical protein
MSVRTDVRAFAAFLIVALATAGVLVAAATVGDDTAPRAPAPSATPEPAARHPISRPARALFAQRPQLGVACRVPNSIRCDRVGFAVWLRRPVDSVSASIAGRRFPLAYQDAPTRVRMYAGFLHPAGLADGPLRVPFTARGMWFGEGRVAARVRVWLEAGGRTTTTVVRVPLRAGWG